VVCTMVLGKKRINDRAMDGWMDGCRVVAQLVVFDESMGSVIRWVLAIVVRNVKNRAIIAEDNEFGIV